MKKFITIVMSFCIVGGSLQAVYSSAPDSIISSSATDYQEVGEDHITYHVYADYAEVYKSDEKAVGEIVIPDKFKGVPVTSISGNAFTNCTKLESIDIPDTVTEIGGAAFWGCSALTSIIIPDSVTKIGYNAFRECTSLESISLSDSLTIIGYRVFFDCTNLKALEIPDSVLSIENEAFCNCSSLESISFPENVDSIGESAFNSCSSIKTITIPDSVTNIGLFAFHNCSNLKSFTILNPDCKIRDDIVSNGCNEGGTKSYYNGIICGYTNSTAYSYAIKKGYKFESIGTVQPKTESITEVPTEPPTLVEGDYEEGYLKYHVYKDHAEVSKCSSEAQGDIAIEKEINEVPVTIIGNLAFDNCKKLSSIKLPESLITISRGAFYNCINLKSINIPPSVASIDYTAFLDCSKLETISVSSDNKYFTSSNGVLFSKDMTKLLRFPSFSSIQEYTIPDTITTVSYFAFNGCSNLNKISIPDSVTSINDFAFAYCSSIKSIDLPSSIERLGDFSLAGCSNLETIKLPEKSFSIGEGAFVDCYKLTDLTFPKSFNRIRMDWIAQCKSLKTITIMNPDCEIEPFDGEYSSFEFGNPNPYDLNFNGIIYGYSNSTAERFANEYGFTFVEIGSESPTAESKTRIYSTIMGDANLDKLVNIADAVLVMQVATNPDKYAQGKSEFSITAQGEINADVDGKKGLSNSDALLIQKFKLGLIDKF